MALVTGNLSTFGLNAIILKSPRLLFVPSGPAVTGAYVLATRPVEAVIATDGSGAFTVNLAATQTLRPERWYSIRVEWLDSASNYVGLDLPDWKLFVPEAGGSIGDLLNNLPSNPSQIWFGETAPIDPTPYTGWVNTVTAQYFEWSA